MPPRVCLTFDTEERFHSHLTPADAPREWRVGDRVAALIDWLGEHGKPATFFVVGELAQRYPDLMRRLAEGPFEVASHSHTHRRFTRRPGRTAPADEAQHRALCRRELRQSKAALEDLTGQRVVGFRAPSWSASIEDDWLWKALCELGFEYDSSLFPFATPMYGAFRNPPGPCWLRPGLLELPPSVYRLGPLRLPYGGSFYFRVMPFSTTKLLLRHDHRRARRPLLYFHPWEFDSGGRCHETGLLQRFVATAGTQSLWSRLTSLLGETETTTLQDWRAELLERNGKGGEV